MRILVCGATGYIGGRLIPALLEDGHQVRGLARRPEKLQGRTFVDDPLFEIVAGDVLDDTSLERACEDIDVIYYLVHSLKSSGSDFDETDCRAAETVARVAAAQGVQRIIYLSGLGDDQSELSHHLRSRHRTGEALRTGAVPVTELRAAIIVGSGSASFEIIKDLSHRLPIMVTPRWVHSICEPISIRDMVFYLVAILDEPRSVGEILEVGNGEHLEYAELIRICGDVQGRTPFIIDVPLLTPRLSAYWLHLVTSVDMSIAAPLIEGLRNDVICTDPRIRDWIPRELSSYRLSVERALARQRAGHARESRWTDARNARKHRHRAPHSVRRTGRPDYRDYRTYDTNLTPHDLFERVQALGGDEGYGRLQALWWIRGAVDRLIGGTGLRRGHPTGRTLYPGDPIDFWRVDHVVPDQALSLEAEMLVPGDARLEFRIEPLPDGGSRLHQLATLTNDGWASTLYWRGIQPFHDFIFHDMAMHIIGSQASVQAPTPDPTPH